MVVIVHDAQNRRGCLAHLPWRQKDPWQLTFYLIEEMIEKIPTKQNLEIVLVGGHAFDRKPNPNLIEDQNENLSGYIRRKLSEKDIMIRSIQDHEHKQGVLDKQNVLYISELSKIVLVLDQMNISNYRKNGIKTLANQNDDVIFLYTAWEKE
jgi:hypothetical protein